jgi:hypothetical protein
VPEVQTHRAIVELHKAKVLQMQQKNEESGLGVRSEFSLRQVKSENACDQRARGENYAFRKLCVQKTMRSENYAFRKRPSECSGASSLLSVIAKDFAEKLASDILTVAASDVGGIECDRAQMMQKLNDGTERNMGGRNKASLIRLIECHILDRFDG